AGDGTPQVVDKLKLASARGSDTVKGLDNLLYVRGGGTLPANMDAKVQGSALEGSNVNMAQSLVDMIENQRAYDVTASMMKSAKDMDEGGASLMRLPT
ncbi:MAG: flagellar biosynthesis protein FlgF, partial [Sphingomonas sp.]